MHVSLSYWFPMMHCLVPYMTSSWTVLQIPSVLLMVCIYHWVVWVWFHRLPLSQLTLYQCKWMLIHNNYYVCMSLTWNNLFLSRIFLITINLGVFLVQKLSGLDHPSCTKHLVDHITISILLVSLLTLTLSLPLPSRCQHT